MSDEREKADVEEIEDVESDDFEGHQVNVGRVDEEGQADVGRVDEEGQTDVGRFDDEG